MILVQMTHQDFGNGSGIYSVFFHEVMNLHFPVRHKTESGVKKQNVFFTDHHKGLYLHEQTSTGSFLEVVFLGIEGEKGLGFVYSECAFREGDNFHYPNLLPISTPSVGLHQVVPG